MTTTTQPTASEQFANDYLMVAENDYQAWSELLDAARDNSSVPALSDILREHWEKMIEKVFTSLKRERDDQTALDDYQLDLLRQMLNGWGSTPFDAIARVVLERAGE